MKSIAAVNPPTVTEYGKSGFGDCACGDGKLKHGPPTLCLSQYFA
jgi:hypothetical protein